MGEMNEDLRALLLADAGIAAVVGPRVDWTARPEGDPLPAIVLHQVTGAPLSQTLDGPSAAQVARVQVDCWAVDFGTAKRLSRAVLAALSGHRGGGFTGVFHAATRDGREGGTNEAVRPYRTSLDFTIHHKP